MMLLAKRYMSFWGWVRCNFYHRVCIFNMVHALNYFNCCSFFGCGRWGKLVACWIYNWFHGLDSGFWLVTICFILGFMKIHAVTLRLSCLCFDLLIELLYFLGLENFFFFYCLSRIMQNYVYVCGWGHAIDNI